MDRNMLRAADRPAPNRPGRMRKALSMDRWLASALDYLPRWIEFQMRVSQQPGCIIAIAHRGTTVLELAFGSADLTTGEVLTPRHRFRVASHSKSFTAAGILKLREQGKLKLDEPSGQFVGARRQPSWAWLLT